MGVDVADDGTVYGLWHGDSLIAVGSEGDVERIMRQRGVSTTTVDVIRPRSEKYSVRVLTHSSVNRRPSKWRDIAAAELRDLNGYTYEEIADMLHITVGMAQGAVSRVRCGRYAHV